MSESCISRAAPALLMIPKLVFPSVPFGLPQFTQLKALSRQTRVEYFDRAVLAHLDVGGLQIAVHDPLLVSGVERVGRLTRDVQNLGE